MPRDFLTGLPRAPHLIGLPAASKQGTSGKAFTPFTRMYFQSGSITVPAGATTVTIEVRTPGGMGGPNQRGSGGGGAYAKKTRAVVAGEVISWTIDQGGNLTGVYTQGATNGSISIDGIVGTGGQNGSDPYGGNGGTISGGDENRSGGAGVNYGGGGGSCGGPGVNGNPGNGTIGGASVDPTGSGAGGAQNTPGNPLGGGAGGGASGTTTSYLGGVGAVTLTFS